MTDATQAQDGVQTQGETLFDLKGVSFCVGGSEILAALDLQLTAGRMTGIIGPNGSGKSSLIKLLARQQVPSSGEIAFLGQPLSARSNRDLACRLAYMPQFTPSAEGMTVRELVELGRFPWRGALGRMDKTDAAKVAEAIRRTGLEAFADRLVDSLSGGERQRCWLAMMLAQDAKCLLLDEPTSALDLAHQADMLKLVSDLTREGTLSAVVVLHDINMAARYCDEIIAVKRGRVAARGTPAEIVTTETLAELYDLPMGVMPHPATGQPLGYVL
ncbi:ATP-binding cassette domain-containing protein [Pseudohoeflea suaedae]|uniref:ATP-binding cassette domain-containing protein n=1 Tax=Pseudohoeflea suaedae TaxID=877384 RepID=A0A4R5PMC3_9HYPH|nr:ATP-binding cassette domain-containing protein [Pseudohoeflea suaedae]TDH37647.1 ATP-binding cassette domain-containing protein [Pseudohoeflea suaedae]